MQAADNVQAVDNVHHHKYHEDTFTVYNPGLLANPPASARMITCLDTQPVHLYCEDHPNIDEKGNCFDKPAIILEMKGSLRREPNFYFTICSNRDEPSFEADASSRCTNASCWLGPPADGQLENAVWRQGLWCLQAIGRKNGAITSELVRPKPGKASTTTDLDLLQISATHAPVFLVQAIKVSCKNPMSYMPVYDNEENQRPFRTLSEVPFGSRIRVRFTLESGRPEGWDESKPDIMAARLLAMHIL
ncbi:hypothetical protein EWM64_g6487 [Hericium alpestre]|uniref:Uncharacterized protein n=1 Tax=Hericium alpestre TaxID=135208 RepID=A0A4Y9ZVK5_9AGAM|nr:hypothetical protein EWM64_g6487 [Hericium alpestre]